MRKPRLIVIAGALALIAAVGAWWASADRLSAEERLLVGTWTTGAHSFTGNTRWRFGPDRRLAYWRPHGPGEAATMVEWGGRWCIRGSEIVLDGEPNGVRRAVSPALRRLGLPYNVTTTCRLDSIAADEFVLVSPDGAREIWTRAPVDQGPA